MSKTNLNKLVKHLGKIMKIDHSLKLPSRSTGVEVLTRNGKKGVVYPYLLEYCFFLWDVKVEVRQYGKAKRNI